MSTPSVPDSEPLTAEEEAKFRESVALLGPVDDYGLAGTLHWSNRVAARLLATLNAERASRPSPVVSPSPEPPSKAEMYRSMYQQVAAEWSVVLQRLDLAEDATAGDVLDLLLPAGAYDLLAEFDGSVCPACHHRAHDPGGCSECPRCELHTDEAAAFVLRIEPGLLKSAALAAASPEPPEPSDEGIVMRAHVPCCWCGEHHEEGN